MKRHPVLLTAGAESDLRSIHEYVREADGAAAADRLLDRLIRVGSKLSEHPDSGSFPKELLALGIREYRQLHLKPYRIFYRVVDGRVIITLMAEGRRDMQALLARRLLGAD